LIRRDHLVEAGPPSGTPRGCRCRVLIRDQADRDAISADLLRYRDERRDDWGDIIDMLTMHPDEGRRVARLLGEIEAAATS
jgi:hypothetical protein